MTRLRVADGTKQPLAATAIQVSGALRIGVYVTGHYVVLDIAPAPVTSDGGGGTAVVVAQLRAGQHTQIRLALGLDDDVLTSLAEVALQIDLVGRLRFSGLLGEIIAQRASGNRFAKKGGIRVFVGGISVSSLPN